MTQKGAPSRLLHTDTEHIEWTLGRDGQRITCHGLQSTRGTYTLRIMNGNVRFFDVSCGSRESVVACSLEVFDTLRGHGWVPESHPA